MAITAKELVRKYKEDPRTAKKHLTFLQALLLGIKPVINGDLDLPVTVRFSLIGFENALEQLVSDTEKTDAELEDAFGQMLNTRKLLDVSLDENRTVREAMLGGNNVKTSNETKLKQFDKFFGTTLSKPGKTIARSDEDVMDALIQSDYSRSQSASAWIKGFMKIGNTKAQRELNPDYLEEKISKIMAARALSGCKRDDKQTLTGTDLTENRIIEEAEKLRSDPTFRQFMKNVKNTKGWNAAARKALGSGHAGGLDTLFTQFIAEAYGPGKMPNDPSLKRYMPTAKQRIEALQLQEMHSRGDATWAEVFTATGPRPGSRLPKFDYTKASAEVLVLRNMIKAERDSKSTLDRQVPADGTLEAQVKTLSSDKAYKKIANHPPIKELFSRGHGGKMIEKMRELETVAGVGEAAKKLMNANTIGARIKEIQETSGKIWFSLSDDYEYDENDQKSRVEHVDKLTKEYYVLNEASGKKNPDGTYDYKDLDKNLLKDVPWSKVNNAAASPSPLSNLSKEGAIDIAWGIKNKTQKEFFNDAARKEKGNIENQQLSRSSSVFSDNTYYSANENDQSEKHREIPSDFLNSSF